MAGIILWLLSSLLSCVSTVGSQGTPPTVFVTIQPCLVGACRTGHQMENTVSAFIACALMDGKVDNIPWKYSHQLSNTRNGNSATELFDLKKYTTATQGYDKIKLKPLSAKFKDKDPAYKQGALDERWGGHTDYDLVMKTLTNSAHECSNLAKRSSKPKVACMLELQYAWRLNLPRLHVWIQTKQVKNEALIESVRLFILTLYCNRMKNEASVRSLLYETPDPNAPLRITVHARRGDRVNNNPKEGDDKLSWVRNTGGDGQGIASLVEGLMKAITSCNGKSQSHPRPIELTVHSEKLNSDDLDSIPWKSQTVQLINPPKGSHKIFTSNSLPLDLAMMVTSDVFVMSSSQLSNLAAGLRGGREEALSVCDTRSEHLPKVQYPGDPILEHSDPKYYIGWDEEHFVRGDEKVLSGGESQALQCYHFVPRREPICPPHLVNATRRLSDIIEELKREARLKNR